MSRHTVSFRLVSKFHWASETDTSPVSSRFHLHPVLMFNQWFLSRCSQHNHMIGIHEIWQKHYQICIKSHNWQCGMPNNICCSMPCLERQGLLLLWDVGAMYNSEKRIKVFLLFSMVHICTSDQSNPVLKVTTRSLWRWFSEFQTQFHCNVFLSYLLTHS